MWGVNPYLLQPEGELAFKRDPAWGADPIYFDRIICGEHLRRDCAG